MDASETVVMRSDGTLVNPDGLADVLLVDRPTWRPGPRRVCYVCSAYIIGTLRVHFAAQHPTFTAPTDAPYCLNCGAANHEHDASKLYCPENALRERWGK